MITTQDLTKRHKKGQGRHSKTTFSHPEQLTPALKDEAEARGYKAVAPFVLDLVLKDKRLRKADAPVRQQAGWRHSGTTVFVLGILLIGVLLYCAAVYAVDHQGLRSWMVPFAFVIGIFSTYVLMDGSDE